MIQEPDDPNLKFVVSLRCRHPVVHPDVVSAALEWDAWVKHVAGEPRATPTGILLDGIYPISYWVSFEERRGTKRFFSHVLELVAYLEGRREFVRDYVRSGGSVTLCIELWGALNIGDDISPEDLMRIARLGITLGVEVFPNMN